MKKIFKIVICIVLLILFIKINNKLSEQDLEYYNNCIEAGNGSQYCARQIGV